MVFNDKAVKLIQEHSNGIPRLINVLCDRSLLGAYVEGKRVVNSQVVQRAAAEIMPEIKKARPEKITWWSTLSVALASVLLALWLSPRMLKEFDKTSSVDTATTTSTVIVNEVESVESPQAIEDISLEDLPDETEPELVETPNAVEDRPDLEQLLANISQEAVPQAWSGLFKEWGYESSATTRQQACTQARRVQLRCLLRSGSWNAVMQFQRPVLLLLAAMDGRRVPVLMRSVIDDLASIEIDSTEFQILRSDLQRFWFGDYQLLWQVPPGGHSVLRPGDQGSDIIWLREQLQNALNLETAQIGSNVYSQELKSLVERFQLKRGLRADGIAGPETIIYLNTATRRPGTPLLQSTQMEGVSTAHLPGSQ
jgi:general secretion pathway protein A